ncbi:CD9 antigen-like isoform X1 [Leptotrombidium deliense]|uniref:Tetraspanin n=1 Tax=Leptotrombidium deliense TaxID=299467 RepID=A0A443SEC7_9ACAR|nr:CD9 antigen-like isoform X1 [Leptotrombidium deliense]
MKTINKLQLLNNNNNCNIVSKVTTKKNLFAMALSCGAKCAKLLLLVFNAILWASGIILFALGVFLLVEDDRSLMFKLFASKTTSYALPQYLAWSFVAIGAAIFFIGFCGCCGALRESRWLLLLYSIFLLLIFASELAIGILAVVFQEKVVAELKLSLTSKLRDEFGFNSALTAAVDLVQTKYECCGISGAEDYRESSWKHSPLSGGNNVSMTCCVLLNMMDDQAYINPRPLEVSRCQSNDRGMNEKYRHHKGCEAALENFIRSECLIFIIIGCGFAAVVMFGLVISMCLCRVVGRHRSSVDHSSN